MQKAFAFLNYNFYIIVNCNFMNKYEFKDYMKDFKCEKIKDNLEKMSQSMIPKMEKFKTPIIDFPKDYKLEELFEISNKVDKISEKVEKIEKNSKNPFWKSLLLAIIGGSVGFFLGLLFL